MNTTVTVPKVSAQEKELLELLYRRSKICDGMQINFLAAQLGYSAELTESIVCDLQRRNWLYYQKYGVLRLTENGKAYLQYAAESAKLKSGDKYEKSDHYSGLF